MAQTMNFEIQLLEENADKFSQVLERNEINYTQRWVSHDSFMFEFKNCDENEWLRITLLAASLLKPNI